MHEEHSQFGGVPVASKYLYNALSCSINQRQQHLSESTCLALTLRQARHSLLQYRLLLATAPDELSRRRLKRQSSLSGLAPVLDSPFEEGRLKKRVVLLIKQ